MSSLRPELHVAQQIRRDKLRIQNSTTSHQQLQEFPNNLEQLSLHQGLNLDLIQVRNIRNGGNSNNNNNSNMLDDPSQPQALYSSEMMSLSSAEPSRLMIMPHQYGSFPHSSSSIHSSSPKEQREEPRNISYGNWRNSSGSHDWMVHYATSSVANQSNNPHHSFLANELNNSNNVSAHYVKPSCNNVLTNVQSSQNSACEMHYPNSASSNPLYQNALQDIFNKASNSIISGHGSEMASPMPQAGHGTWGGNNASEHVLHSSYGGSTNTNLWINRGVDNNTLRWNSPLGFTEKKANDSSNPQGLSLSLSSNSQSKPCTGEGSASNDPQSGNKINISKDHEYVAKYVKFPMLPSNVSRDCTGKSLQDPMGLPPNTSYRNVGPLGPFTGYATILKSSRFLRPCQQLLDEYCCQSGSKPDKACDDVPEWVSRDVSASSADAVNVDESGVAAGKGSNAVSSSSMFYGSTSKDNSNDGGAASNFCVSSRPECQKNKAKLLFMQEEVTRRYKQHHQQMQMVVSSFESVAGLNSATPYVSLALKSVSRHFRSLKNAISDQLKLICEALGEDLLIPTTSPSGKFDTSMARPRCMDQSFQRNKSGGGNMDFIEPQHHVWRPQRGLPERSVAILKAWLFEHFLHPYPTDTDKHMLATQTGLSRNQVSNWFINARVRVWKPMVEEIHMLETKGVGGANQRSSKNEGTSASEGSSSHPRVDQPLNMFGTHATNAIPGRQFQCLEMGSSSLASVNDETALNEEQWSPEKRSKLECQITSGMDGTLMGFMPFRRGASALEVGGLGPVSLTLGLRHGVEGAHHHQQQQLQHEEQLRRHFGGHMIHDFVG